MLGMHSSLQPRTSMNCAQGASCKAAGHAIVEQLTQFADVRSDTFGDSLDTIRMFPKCSQLFATWTGVKACAIVCLFREDNTDYKFCQQ